MAEQAPHLAEIARRFHGDTLLWAGCQTNLAETVRGCMVRHRFYTLCSVAPQDAEAGGVFDCELHALPLPNASLDAIVVHHGLDWGCTGASQGLTRARKAAMGPRKQPGSHSTPTTAQYSPWCTTYDQVWVVWGLLGPSEAIRAQIWATSAVGLAYHRLHWVKPAQRGYQKALYTRDGARYSPVGAETLTPGLAGTWEI